MTSVVAGLMGRRLMDRELTVACIDGEVGYGTRLSGTVVVPGQRR